MKPHRQSSHHTTPKWQLTTAVGASYVTALAFALMGYNVTPPTCFRPTANYEKDLTCTAHGE